MTDASALLNRALNAPIQWERVEGSFVEWSATLDGVVYRLTMNDFPEEPLYTLRCGDASIDLDDAPLHWKIPLRR